MPGPSVVDPRLEGVRKILQQKIDTKAIDAAFLAWEPSTLKNYGSYWAKWGAFCDENGKDPFAVDNAALASWLGQLVLTKALGESSISSAATVVSSTWDLIFDPATLISKIKKGAGKINTPAQKKVKMAWDLAYLHLYIGGEDIGSLNSMEVSTFSPDFKGLMEETICKLKGATGWRQDDLAGVYFEHSLSFTSAGAYVSMYDSKIGQRVHSAPIFLPSLSPRFARIDVVVSLRKVNDYIAAHKPLFKLSQIKDKHGVDCTAIPIFTYVRKKEHYALQPATIGNYFKRAFLENVSDGPEHEKLSATHPQHSSRHAVASALFKMGVSPSDISTLTLNSPATLQQTYILPVFQSYTLPEECIKMQKHLSVKLLVPYVHWHTSTKNGEDAIVDGTCGCAELLLQ
jgi:hypothetical protein